MMRKYTDISTQDPPDRPTWVDGDRQPVPARALHAGRLRDHGGRPRRSPKARSRATCTARTCATARTRYSSRAAIYHWFDGDGMVHGVYLRDGRASYIRKWVQTRALHDEIAQGKVELSGHHGPVRHRAGRRTRSHVRMNAYYCKDTSNTTLNLHNGKLLSAWYNAGRVYRHGPAHARDGSRGDFAGGLDTPMNAHGKVDARTGEFINYGYADFQPWLTYYVISADGKVRHKTRDRPAGPAPAARHDDHAELHDPARFPAVSRHGRAAAHRAPRRAVPARPADAASA